MANDNNDEFDVKDFLNWRSSRRTVLRSGAALAGAGLLSGLLAACTGGDTPAGTTNAVASASPGAVHAVSGVKSLVPTPRDKTVIIDQGPFSVYHSFNPLIPNGEQYQAGVAQVAKEYLFYLNLATGKLVNWQGKSWSYNAAFDTMTLKLSPDVTWNDGKPFTSADIEFTVNLVKSHSSQVTSGEWTTEVKSMQVPDAHTVVFHLTESDPRFHYNLICQIISANLLVVPEHIWSGKKADSFKFNPPVYTGPYKLQSTKPNLKMYVWEKDPNYWNNAKLDPKPQYVVYRSAPAADAEIQQFKDGQIDSPAGAATSYYAQGPCHRRGEQERPDHLVRRLRPARRHRQLRPVAGKARRPEVQVCDLGAGRPREDRDEYLGGADDSGCLPVAALPQHEVVGERQHRVEVRRHPRVQPDGRGHDARSARTDQERGAVSVSSYGKALSLRGHHAQSSRTPAAEFLIAQVLAKDLKAVGIASDANTCHRRVQHPSRQGPVRHALGMVRRCGAMTRGRSTTSSTTAT